MASTCKTASNDIAKKIAIIFGFIIAAAILVAAAIGIGLWASKHLDPKFSKAFWPACKRCIQFVIHL